MAWIKLSTNEWCRSKGIRLHDYINTEGIHKISTYEAEDNNVNNGKDDKLYILLIDSHGFVYKDEDERSDDHYKILKEMGIPLEK